LAQIIEHGWHNSPENRPLFPHILRQLIDCNEPLFPETDMTIYGEYRQHLLAATFVDPDYHEIVFGPILRDEDIPFFRDTLEKVNTGNAEFQLRVGGMYERGIGTERDFVLAFHYYFEAAKQELSIAMFNVGKCYLSGLGTKASKAQALLWLKKAANDPRLPQARYELGSVLFKKGGNPAEQSRGFAVRPRRTVQILEIC
jgi:TPR repeat protein